MVSFTTCSGENKRSMCFSNQELYWLGVAVTGLRIVLACGGAAAHTQQKVQDSPFRAVGVDCPEPGWDPINMRRLVAYDVP